MNRGPSDFYHAEAKLILPTEVMLAAPVEGTTLNDSELYYGIAMLPADNKAVYILPMQLNLSRIGKYCLYHQFHNSIIIGSVCCFSYTPFCSMVQITNFTIIDPY
jgi:hypothetical protein